MTGRLPSLLTVEEAAQVLRIGRTKAYALAREWRSSGGRSGLPVVDLGDVLRVPLARLEAMIGTSLGEAEVPSLPAKRSKVPADPPPVPGPQSSVPPARQRRRRGVAQNQLGLFPVDHEAGGPP